MTVLPDHKLAGDGERYVGTEEAVREEEVDIERIEKVYRYVCQLI